MHFAAYVLVPPECVGDHQQLSSDVAARLARYDVARPDTQMVCPCACRGRRAWQDFEHWRGREFADLGAGDDDPVLQARIDAAEQAYRAVHPLREMVDPHCPQCAGEGQVTVLANPEGRLDSWMIGGGWQGRFDPQGRGRDVLPVVEIIAALSGPEDDDLPSALIDGDGEWYDCDLIFPQTPATRATWHRWVTGELARCAEHYAVVVDCHS